MKKVLLLLIILLPFNVVADSLIDATFNKCVDGDTAYLMVNGEKTKVRLLAVDTPETKHPKKGKESGGETASEYTCNRLKSASKIQIEYDEASSKQDKYGRDLVWLYLDGELFQSDLVSNGYAEVGYIYGKYKYVSELCDIQRNAVNKGLGIWSNNDRTEGYCSTNSNTKKNKITTETVDEKESQESDFDTPYFLLIVVTYFIILVFKNILKKK